MMSGWRVVDEKNSSGRVNTHFTGRPVFFDSSASTGSVVISFLPPKLPPTMVATMRMRLIGMPSVRAMSARPSVMRPRVE